MKISIVLLLLFTLLSVLSASETTRADDKTLPQGVIKLDGRTAPALALSDMDGNAFQLSDAKGQWVFVHFWASWCGPCRREMPTIQKMSAQIDTKLFNIVLVNTAETDDTVFGFLGIAAPELTTLMDYDGKVTERWQPRGLPASFFVDPNGKLQYLALGGRDWVKPVYSNFIKKLLAQ